MNYRDRHWLAEQIHLGLTPTQIATAANVPVEAVIDHLKKNGLDADVPYPTNLTTDQLLSWCGRHRRPIKRNALSDHNSKIVVLGAGGFVGNNLCRYLARANERPVIGIARMDCDLMQRDSLVALLRVQQPQVVVNLAAFVGGIGFNKDNPADMIYKNLIMSANVIDACFTVGVRKLVAVSTVCAYPKIPPIIPFRESDLWSGFPEDTNAPYGVAKRAMGEMLMAYKRQFNFSSICLIPTNMYGPHDDFSDFGSHVIPAMIKKFLAAKNVRADTVTLWGDGSPSREFLFVDDFCTAVRLASDSDLDCPLPINVGNGVEVPMRELATTIAGLVNYTGKIIWDASQPNGQPRRCLDVTRARSMLGFTAKTPLADGLRRTIDWYVTENGVP